MRRSVSFEPIIAHIDGFRNDISEKMALLSVLSGVIMMLIDLGYKSEEDNYAFK